MKCGLFDKKIYNYTYKKIFWFLIGIIIIIIIIIIITALFVAGTFNQFSADSRNFQRVEDITHIFLYFPSPNSNRHM